MLREGKEWNNKKSMGSIFSEGLKPLGNAEGNVRTEGDPFPFPITDEKVDCSPHIGTKHQRGRESFNKGEKAIKIGTGEL